MAPLVSVVIPAFNAAATIARTIASVQAQTLQDLEMVVVDDGSADATCALVQGLAGADPRIRLITQANAGCAAARHAGILAATGTFVAPLDADDIWHPAKLERQVAAIRSGGARIGLVYNWFRRIDGNDIVVPGSPAPHVEGRVLHRHLEWNFVSNGSTPLVPRALAQAVGVFQPVAGPGRQGCEDYLFQLRIARTHAFACVPAWLTGYRLSPGSMSHQVERMIRAHLATYTTIANEAGMASISPVIARRRAQLLVELARNRLAARQPAQAARALAGALGSAPLAACRHLGEQARALPGRLGSRNAYPQGERPFGDFAADEPDGPWQTRRSARWLARLARLDATLEGASAGPVSG